MSEQWFNGFSSLHINDPLSGPFRSYHSSDESDPGSPGGTFRTGYGSGRVSIETRRHGATPSFSAHGQLLVEESPYLPPREPPPQQYVSPANLTAPPHQYFQTRNQNYYRDVDEQWTSGAPPPYYASPEQYYTPPSGPLIPTAMPPSAFQQTSRFPDAGDYLRNLLNLPQGSHVSLWSLAEPPGGQRPSYSIPVLIKLAIYGSPRKRLTLQEIYEELCNRFTWFREHQHERAWKNSIRHNLSLKAMFVNTPRPVTEPGKGSYWELDVTAGDGDSRERKRRKRPTGRNEEDDDDEDEDGDEDDDGSSSNSGRSRGFSTSTTGGNPHGRSLTMLDPPASQRRPATYSQPGYGPAYAQHNPAPTPGPSSFRQPSGRTLAHSRSATPLDAKPPFPEGRQLRPRPSLSSSNRPSFSTTDRSVSPTDEAYAKSRRRAPGHQ